MSEENKIALNEEDTSIAVEENTDSVPRRESATLRRTYDFMARTSLTLGGPAIAPVPLTNHFGPDMKSMADCLTRPSMLPMPKLVKN
jgi:hypothetical protein